MNPLPTPAAFRSLTLRQRSTVFLNWVKSQPADETYNSCSIGDCVFVRFAKALGVEGGGANYGFEYAGDNIQVLPYTRRWPDVPIHNPADEGFSVIYANLLKRLRAYLKRKDCRWKPHREDIW